MTNFFQLFITGILTGSMYAAVAASVVLIFKATNVVSIAHGQFLSFGALFFWFCLTVWQIPFWISILLILAVTILLGFLVERFVMRPLIGQPMFAAFLMTFSLFLAMDGIFQLILKGQARSLPTFLPKGVWKISGLNIPVDNLVSFFACLLIFLILTILFRFSRVGLGMRATSEDHQLAQSVGIGVKTIFSLIWIISTVVAAFTGIVIASVTDIHFPLPYIVIKGMIVAIFGGLESLTGALVGGILLGIIENISAGYLDPLVGGGVQEVAAYVVLLLILLVKPYGLFGLPRIERI